MKFVSEGEQAVLHSAQGRKPDSKHFDYHENGLDSTGLKSENNIVKECHTDALCASKANEGVADHLPHVTNDADGWTARKFDGSTSFNDLAKNNEKDVPDLEAPSSHSCAETESFEDAVFYMDRRVSECELPELIVCYKENIYHVKDICIDEGVQSYDRISFESNVDEKGVRSLFPPEEDRNSELTEEKKKSVLPIPDVLKSSVENVSDEDIVSRCDSSQESDCDEDIVDPRGSKDLMPAGDDVTDEMINDSCKKLLSLGDLLQGSSGKASLANPASACPAEGSNGGTEEALLGGSDLVSANNSSGESIFGNPALVSATERAHDNCGEATLASTDLVSASEESHNGSGEAILGNPALVSATERPHDNSGGVSLASTDLVSASDKSTKLSTADNISYDSMVETASITFDFDASAPRARGKEEHLQIGDSQRFETLGTSRLEDDPRQSVSSQVHSVIGESSFSAADSLPSLISYSGPVAYSGSVSLRSDSSTTSTRSFAFPILQSEWNNSPVRMVKADRRHYRKHKWRQGLFCCRF